MLLALTAPSHYVFFCNWQVRACLVAVRPWSLPASIVPITVTAALLHQSHPG